METFRTRVELPEYPFQIDHNFGVGFLGSCFSEHMESRFRQSGFSTAINPNGIIFHPVPLAKSLLDCIENSVTDELLASNGKWISLSHHGSFSSNVKEDTMHKIGSSRSSFNSFLGDGSLLFITFGTANAYVHNESNLAVANCHKLPQSQFQKQLFSIEAMKTAWTAALTSLKKMNPEMQVIFTLSPVRYWRDGAHGNQISKARLMLLIDELVAENENCHYFPAYEIVLDELRDYRFYAEDMLHVSDLAAEYVFKRLSTSLIKQKSLDAGEEIRRKSRILNHKAEDKESFAIQLKEVEQNIQKILSNAGFSERAKAFRLVRN